VEAVDDQGGGSDAAADPDDDAGADPEAITMAPRPRGSRVGARGNITRWSSVVPQTDCVNSGHGWG
jgi:hypothetical protein